MSAAGLSTKNAPSPSVVLPHYAYGALAFIVASIMIFFAADNIVASNIGPKVLSITHVLVLGWITMIIFGALYQLIPVVMEIKLYSEKLALASFFLLGGGTILMSWGFWNSYIGETYLTMAGGTMIIIAVILFAINTLKSAAKSVNKTIENKFIVSSVFWLLITVLVGIFIIVNASHPMISKSNLELLKIHIQFGIIGWFMMLVVGVASTLMPMFFIAHQLNKKYLETAYYLINGGLIALIIALYVFPNQYLIFALGTVIFAGMVFFIKYNYDAYKKRLRRKLDIGMKLSVLAFTILFSTLIFGILSAIKLDILSDFNMKFNLAYGISLFLGFLTSLILGQMYKTLPFIVWLQKYQDKVGKYKIPLPAELYSEKVADAHYYTFFIAILTIIAGVFLSSALVVQISAVAFFITALLFGYNTLLILIHKQKLEPLK